MPFYWLSGGVPVLAGRVSPSARVSSARVGPARVLLAKGGLLKPIGGPHVLWGFHGPVEVSLDIHASHFSLLLETLSELVASRMQAGSDCSCSAA